MGDTSFTNPYAFNLWDTGYTGGDKTLPYLNVEREHALYLGIRGVRFLLYFPDFLHVQLRVFHRLAARHRSGYSFRL
ncbi:MAG: hypothetical protein GF344_09295 [Chitinivibrionales bacterium]|nr:hypothetical protein [Chitinivibrionales bacterium]MBD3357046.1 hypothetical protein [Chitinivibrionales bacterium]